MINAIKSANKTKFDNLIGSGLLGDGNTDKHKKRPKFDDIISSPDVTCSTVSNEEALLRMLDEKCNGNQNVMHVAGSNLLKTKCK